MNQYQVHYEIAFIGSNLIKCTMYLQPVLHNTA